MTSLPNTGMIEAQTGMEISSGTVPYSPSPSSLPAWPQAAPVLPWRERAAARLATMQAAASAAGRAMPPPYAGNPMNIIRNTFGDNCADIETNRIYEVVQTPPATAESPQLIWPRSPTLLGR